MMYRRNDLDIARLGWQGLQSRGRCHESKSD